MSAEAAPVPRSSSSAGQGVMWRLAAIGVFVGVPLLLIALAVLNLMAASDASETAMRTEDTARTIVHQVERVRSRPQTGPDLSSIYLASTDVSLARAELQTLAARMVENASARLIESQASDPDNQDAVGRVALKLTLDATNAQLLDLLYAVETNVPILTVTELNARSQNDEGAKPEASGVLRVDLTVRAAWRAPPQ